MLLCLAALASLALFRPALPDLSLGGTLTAALIQRALWCVAWLLGIYVVLALLVRAAQVVIHGPASEREAILPGVIPAPPPPLPPTPLAERFQPPFKLVLAPRPHPADPGPQAHGNGHGELPARARPPSPAPELSICLLGPLKIESTRRALKRLPTRELVAYLALHPHGATRDELTEAIWPCQDPERTLPRFWQIVTDARHALGDAWVREGERYRLDRELIRIDLDELDRLLAASERDGESEPGALEAALSLWRGQPLEGSDYAWADGDIRRLSATYLGLLERAGHARLQGGDARGALHMAEQAISLDQFHEASWRLALQAEHALGLRESITRRYEDLAGALDQELGLRPTRETRVMYRELLGQG